MTQSKHLLKGVVLAGGEGKRLRPLTYYFQKCMIPIGHSQKPLLEYIIRLLRYHKIADILLLAGYKKEQITNYFNSGNRFGVKINFVLDNPKLQGTGGSLLNAYQRGLLNSCENILIYYGDILSDINLTQMWEQHVKQNAVATLALSKSYQLSVGVATVKGKEVVNWVEKPTLNIDVGIGILFLKTSVLPELASLSPHQSNLDIMSHFIPYLIERKMSVQAYLTNAFWYDVGSVERYEKLNKDELENRLRYLFKEKGNYPGESLHLLMNAPSSLVLDSVPKSR